MEPRLVIEGNENMFQSRKMLFGHWLCDRDFAAAFACLMLVAMPGTLYGRSDPDAGEKASAIGPDGDNETLAPKSLNITINDLPQGNGYVLDSDNGFFLEASVTRAANLKCSKTIEISDRKFCAVKYTKKEYSGNNLNLVFDLKRFFRSKIVAHNELPKIDEIPNSKLVYLNYDLNPSLFDGDVAFTANMRGGLTLGTSAFELSGLYSHIANAGTQSRMGALAGANFGANTLLLTEAAWRHFDFDRRVLIEVGRQANAQRGFIGGGIFDGIGIARRNIDNQGNLQVTQSRLISGYNPTAGILTYRLGEAVLKQVPLAAGPYTLDPSIFDGLPAGGVVEITSYDGQVFPLQLPIASSSLRRMFKKGTWDGSFQVGRMAIGPQFIPALNAGARYGFSSGISAELGVLATPDSVAMNLEADVRLPHDLGDLGFVSAVQWRRLAPDLSLTEQHTQGWSARAYYRRKFNSIGVAIDYLRNANGGIIAGGYAALAAENGAIVRLRTGSILKEELQLAVSTPIFKRMQQSLRLRLTRNAGQKRFSKSVEEQISGSLGRVGYWSLFGRYAIDAGGVTSLSGNFNFSIPLGGARATLTYQTDRQNGNRNAPDRYGLTISGSGKPAWNHSNNYNLSIDSGGYGSASYNHEFSALSTAVNVYRNPDNGLNGSMSARGSVVLADGHAVFGRTTGDAPVVLAAPLLPREKVYLAGYFSAVAKTNGAGYAVLPSAVLFGRNLVRVNNENAPLGLETPDNATPGTFYPHRGYIVPVKAHQLVPARVYPILAENVREVGNPTIDIDGVNVPLEYDGSFYVEDITALRNDITVSWQLGSDGGACSLSRAALQAQLTEAGGEFVRKLRSVACDGGPSALASDQPATTPVPVAPPAKRIPYPDFLNVAQNDLLDGAAVTLQQFAALNATSGALASRRDVNRPAKNYRMYGEER